MSYYLSKLESIKSLKELYVFREELLCDLAKNRTHELDTAKIEASQNINFYLEIVERQNHCHKTKKVRGLLCNRCNTLLGLIEDNPVFIQNVTNYLNK